MIDVAVAEGYNILVMSGYIFAAALVEVTYKYPDVKFIVLDMTEGDIIAAAVGGAYYGFLALAIFSRNSRAPKAEGIPYDKGQR